MNVEHDFQPIFFVMKDFGLQTSEVIVNIDQLCLDMDAVDSQVFYLPSQLQQAKKNQRVLHWQEQHKCCQQHPVQ